MSPARSTAARDAAIHALRRAAPSRLGLAAALGTAGLLVVASMATLDLSWRAFLSADAAASMGRFVAEFFPPDLSPRFVQRIAVAAWETFAMSAVGTGLAALLGLTIAVHASRPEASRADRPRRRPRSSVGPAGSTGTVDGEDGRAAGGAARGAAGGTAAALRAGLRGVSNLLRAIPELVWAALLLIAVGLGPFAGTLALALHTTGVLGRLYTEAIENAPPGPGAALRAHGLGRLRVFLYAIGPQILPQLLSYTLYRWENNIRAASVLGVVGAGGLGQMLAFHMGLFQMARTSTVIGAMLLLVAVVDGTSHLVRRALTR